MTNVYFTCKIWEERISTFNCVCLIFNKEHQFIIKTDFKDFSKFEFCKMPDIYCCCGFRFEDYHYGDIDILYKLCGTQQCALPYWWSSNSERDQAESVHCAAAEPWQCLLLMVFFLFLSSSLWALWSFSYKGLS